MRGESVVFMSCRFVMVLNLNGSLGELFCTVYCYLVEWGVNGELLSYKLFLHNECRLVLCYLNHA